MNFTPAPDGIPGAIGARLAVDLDTVFEDLAATLTDLRDRQRRAVHDAAERALGWPAIDEDLEGRLAVSRDRDALRAKYLVALHLAYLGGIPDHDVDDLIADARRYGATWEEVGSTLGITRQTAHGRYRHLDGRAAHLAGVLPGPRLDALVPLDGGDDLTASERRAGARAIEVERDGPPPSRTW